MRDRLSKNDEGPAKVGMDDRVEDFDVVFADGRQGHDARVMNNDINRAISFLCFLEQASYVRGIGYIGLDRDCRPSLAAELGRKILGFGCFASIVNHYIETIRREPFCNGASDTA